MSATTGDNTLNGSGSPDTIDGLAGNDSLRGLGGNDVLIGGDGNDSLEGGGGRDTLQGGSGNDLLDGGGAADIAAFSNVASAYTITKDSNGIITVSGPDGTDTVTNVETLRFVDVDIDTSTIPCFASGTLILTEAGEVPVEALREGDRVALAGGGFAPITWIGRRTVEIARHAWPDLVRPVRVRAGALAEGVPKRDLVLSPEHALALDGVLVPVGLLANGTSIVQERGEARITYHHIELPVHGVLLAEGAPAESYLELGHRANFEGKVTALHPRLAAAEGCAPRVEAGPQLDAIRARLAARAETAFAMEPADSDLHLLVDGVAITAGPGRHRFMLPSGAAGVRIVSRAASPAASGGGDDRRMLGVAIAGITLTGADGLVVRVPMDDPSLSRGFHGVERSAGGVHRWTDGEAVLPARWLAGFGGAPVTLDLTVVAAQRVWLPRRAA
jgi:hypothetical protein